MFYSVRYLVVSVDAAEEEVRRIPWTPISRGKPSTRCCKAGRPGSRSIPGSSNRPPVVVQDMDWISGHSLEAFEILDDAEPVDANLHAKVRLTLGSKESGGESEKTVTYLVSTSPKLTVFRQMMQ